MFGRQPQRDLCEDEKIGSKPPGSSESGSIPPLFPARRKRRRKRNPLPGGFKLGYPVSGGYKYEGLAFQVE
jgi:hypothetical protein